MLVVQIFDFCLSDSVVILNSTAKLSKQNLHVT